MFRNRHREQTLAVPAEFTAANTPFGSNEVGGTLAPGQYNYLLLYDGPPGEDVSLVRGRGSAPAPPGNPPPPPPRRPPPRPPRPPPPAAPPL
ncbi:MAG: hypothetical protein OXC11_02640, partial [Rhodospirillales bacterium]|nr:hypothetical protein [Rhodospirillales bacterium]